MSARRITSFERGLLPLLDIFALLLGFFIVLMAARAAALSDDASVMAGEHFILLEAVAIDERDAAAAMTDERYRLVEVERDSGRWRGDAVPLADAGVLVADILAANGRDGVDRWDCIVVIQVADVFGAEAWSAADAQTLREALAGYRVIFLWGR